MRAYAETAPGRILNCVLTAFADIRTGTLNTQYHLKTWNNLLTRFGELTVFADPPLRPAYTANLVAKALDDRRRGASSDSIQFLGWLRATDPLLFRQRVGKKIIERLQADLPDRMMNLVAKGKEFGIPEVGVPYTFAPFDEYDEWQASGRAVVDAVELAYEWTSSPPPEGLDELKRFLDGVPDPSDYAYDNDSDDFHAGARDVDSYWTVERIFEDL